MSRITQTVYKKGGCTPALFIDCLIQQSKIINATEIKKPKTYITIEVIEYLINAVVIKTILKKPTGNISVMSFDNGQGLIDKTTPFSIFAQIIDGNAEIVINGKSNLLQTGQSIIIPAHAPNFVKPHGQFKMVLTVIKSRFE